MTLDLITFSIAAPLWIYSNAEKKTRLALLGLFVLGAVWVSFLHETPRFLVLVP